MTVQQKGPGRNLTMTTAELARLCHDASAILATAPHTIPGAINWANLTCVRAVQWGDDSGDHGLAVEIEEASPENYELHNHVRAELEKRGWAHVEVRTEW